MKLNRKLLPLFVMGAIVAGAFAQVESGGGVRRKSAGERNKRQSTTETQGSVSDRMTNHYETPKTHDADIEYQRTIYRILDLERPENTPLYYPEDVIDGQENLFRMMFRLVVEEKIPAFEYLDGREVFSDRYKINVGEMLDRFNIYYNKNGNDFVIEEADVPTNQVLAYYIIEKWEYDRRSNRMQTRVEAICPVLNRFDDFGGQTRYPMFWVKMDALRPYMSQTYVFLDDDNNHAKYNLDDYFNMGMYKGDIYKYQNLKNLSMMQMYPDEDDLRRAQDSIDNRLRNYGRDSWVPTREEYLAQQKAEQERARKKAEGDTLQERTVVVSDELATSEKKSSKKRTSSKARVKQPKASNNDNQPNSNATKSVRRKKK